MELRGSRFRRALLDQFLAGIRRRGVEHVTRLVVRAAVDADHADLAVGAELGKFAVNLLVHLRYLHGRGPHRIGDLYLAHVVFAVGFLAEQHHDTRLLGIGHDVGILDKPAVDEFIVGDAAHSAAVGEFRDISRTFAGIGLSGAVIQVDQQETASVFSLVVNQPVAFAIACRDEFRAVDLFAVIAHRQVEETPRVVDTRAFTLEDTSVVGQHIADETAVHEILHPKIRGERFVHELLLQRHLLQQGFAVERSAVLRLIVEEHLVADDGCLFARPVLLQTGVAARKRNLHAGAVLVVIERVKRCHGVADEIIAQCPVLLDKQVVTRDIGLVEFDGKGENRGVSCGIAMNFVVAVNAVGFHVALPVEVLGRRYLFAVDDPAV